MSRTSSSSRSCGSSSRWRTTSGAEATLAALLAETAAVAPERPALAVDGARTTYAELDAAASRAGRALCDHGIRRGDRVAIVLPNTPAFVAAFHGALRIGATVVPINPLASGREVAQRVAASGARVVVSEPLAATGEAAPEAADPDDVAVILFTSGTTGEPKPVELTQARLRHNAEYLARCALGLRDDDVLFGAAPLAHVFGMTGCMNAAIVACACVALVQRFEPGTALDTIERDAVTVFMGVPAMCHALLGDGRAPAMRIAHVGGAPLPLETLRAFEERFGAIVLEGYGMTEVGGAAATNHHDRRRKPGSVGTPAAGGRIRIDGEATGEVLLSSPTAMRGAPEWIATGDIGYLDGDGYLYLVDRKSDVILRGGYNVYPREVEEVLHEHPDVLEAVVVGVPDDRLGEVVVALVVTSGAVEPDTLRTFVAERVAAYKTPRRIHIVDELPRGPTGKVLRRAIDRGDL